MQGAVRKVATVAVVGTALVLAGCGGGGGGGGGTLSKSDYQTKLRSVGKDLSSLSTAATGSSPKSRFEKLRSALNKAADNLSNVTPPSDAKKDNDELVSGLRDLSNELKPIEDAAAKKDKTAFAQALSGLQSASGVKKIQHATSDLRSKGYNNIG